MKTLAIFNLSGNFPVSILLFMRAAMLGDNFCTIVFNILGPKPSILFALMGPRQR